MYHNVPDIPDAETVNEHSSRRNLIDHLRTVPVKRQCLADGQYEDIFLRYAKAFCYAGLRLEMPVFAVYRDRILRLYQRVDKLYLLLAGMSRNMGILENNIRALHAQFVYEL